MVVNFEFLGEEPIENVITCMHYEIDKVVYFGYVETIQKYKDSTVDFLKKHCGVKQVKFIQLPQKNLLSLSETMRSEIVREKEEGNEIFFDITGGESLILVAFGRLSKELDTPIHIFDIEKDKIIEINEGAEKNISSVAKEKKFEFDLDKYIELKGGTINYKRHKGIKGDAGEEFENDVEKIYEVSVMFANKWNGFSNYLRDYMKPDANLCVSRRTGTVISEIQDTNLKTPKTLNRMMDALFERGILLDVVHSDGKYKFRYKNQKVKECICSGGDALELHTYYAEKKRADDCRVGIHLDWDGIIHAQTEEDVVNEIDVLTLQGNIPTFISCKSGKLSKQQSLHALYELDTVTRRFGGKYAKKVLVAVNGLGEAYLERAEEMGIEVRSE